MAEAADTTSKRIDVGTLHEPHPTITAEDWRCPLICRLLGTKTYQDGERILSANCEDHDGTRNAYELALFWTGLASEFERRVNTYQDHVLTEHAALGLSCILLRVNGEYEITEVTQRGDRADYWLGKREYMLEVSGRSDGALDDLVEDKRRQLLDNPDDVDGFVCAVIFATRQASLLFFAAAGDAP